MDTASDSNNTQGGTSQPLAGSQPIDGDRRCTDCRGRGFHVWRDEDGEHCAPCDHCKGTCVEPEAAPRPGASALGPPAPDSLAGEHREPAHRAASGWRFEFLFAWYDAWVGAFWDSKKRKLYILPLPFVGVVVTLPHNEPEAEGGPNTKPMNLGATEATAKETTS